MNKKTEDEIKELYHNLANQQRSKLSDILIALNSASLGFSIHFAEKIASKQCLKILLVFVWLAFSISIITDILAKKSSIKVMQEMSEGNYGENIDRLSEKILFYNNISLYSWGFGIFIFMIINLIKLFS